MVVVDKQVNKCVKRCRLSCQSCAGFPVRLVLHLLAACPPPTGGVDRWWPANGVEHRGHMTPADLMFLHGSSVRQSRVGPRQRTLCPPSCLEKGGKDSWVWELQRTQLTGSLRKDGVVQSDTWLSRLLAEYPKIKRSTTIFFVNLIIVFLLPDDCTRTSIWTNMGLIESTRMSGTTHPTPLPPPSSFGWPVLADLQPGWLSWSEEARRSSSL